MPATRLLPLTLVVAGWAGSALPAAEPKSSAIVERPVDELPILKGPADQPDVPLVRKKNSIGTLVHVHSEDGTPETGFFVRITGTAMPGKPGVPDSLAYEKFLGPLTMKSLDAIMKPVVELHHGWPRGETVQLTFSARPSPAELTPATAASVLLLDSMLRDWDIEQNFAIFGAIQQDGTIDAVGGIPERLAGAGRARVARIAVPEKNSAQVADFLLSQGIASFVGTQIFAVKDFNEAGVLALSQLDPQTKEAVALFGAVQRTLIGAGAGAVPLLRNERVQGTLQQVLAKAPNHLSAKVLFDWGTGARAQISFDGSVETIDRFAPDLIRALHSKPEDALQIGRAQVTNNLAGLKYVHERLDPKTRGYAEALLRFGDVLQRAQGNSVPPPRRVSPTLQAAFDLARTQGNDEWKKMAQARLNAPVKPPDAP